jgi:toxin ParE1/3/4
VPEWSDKTIRELLVYTYRLIYRIDNDSVLVLAVIHGARLLPDVLRERR